MDDPQSGRKAMLTHKELFESVLFQLYYFEGVNYRGITLATSQGDFNDANCVRIFRIDFSMFEQKNKAPSLS
jgi:hypothetical protein